jgi:hypothetical protein
VPAAAVVPSVATAGDADAALAGFLAIGIMVAGALAFGRRWWPPFMLITAGVLLVLLLTPDAYVAFGLLFAGGNIVGIVRWLGQRLIWQSPAGRRGLARV